MLAFIVALALVTPYPVTKVEWYDARKDPCYWMEEAEWRACQPRVINLGTWDPVYHNKTE